MIGKYTYNNWIIKDLALQKYLHIIYAEDASVADSASFARGQQLDISPTAIKVVTCGDAISEFEYAPIRLPNV